VSKKGPGETKRPVGRPPKLTPELIETIQNGIMLGNYLSVVAASCGVRRETIYAWLNRGNREERDGLDTLFTQFSHATRRAMALAEMDALYKIRQAGSVDVKHLEWWLGKFHPEIDEMGGPRWVDRSNVDMTVRTKDAVEDMTPEDREALIAKLEAKRRSGSDASQ
jgi:transposase